MPTLRLLTDRLIIVPYYPDMVKQEHVAWLNDPVVVEYSEQRHMKHTEDTQRAYCAAMDRDSSHLWLIRTRANGHSLDIGTMTAYIDKPNQVCDMGILIGEKSEWGKGYGIEAWLRVMQAMFDEGMRKVEAGCMAENLRMIWICQRSLMVFEGERKGHFLLNGKPVDMVLYGRIK